MKVRYSRFYVGSKTTNFMNTSTSVKVRKLNELVSYRKIFVWDIGKLVVNETIRNVKLEIWKRNRNIYTYIFWFENSIQGKLSCSICYSLVRISQMTNSSFSRSFLIDESFLINCLMIWFIWWWTACERFTRLQDEILVLYHIRECHIFLQMRENFRMHHSVIVFSDVF